MKPKRPGRGARILRRCSALALSAAILYGVVVTVESRSAAEALRAISRSELTLRLLRWELGDFSEGGTLSFTTAMALGEAPMLLSAKDEVLKLWSRGAETDSDTAEEAETDDAPLTDETPLEALHFTDNGVPARTMIPTSATGYAVFGSAYISNTTNYTLNGDAFDGSFDAALTDDAPQILILHTHGSEAYTMPKGEEYTPTSSLRTTDTNYNVVRVGDEIAAVFAQAGVSVVHDRTLYDYPKYSGSYGRSLKGVEAYLAKYPSIRFVLDIHRDAISDAEGNQYKVISETEAGSAAQMTLVLGSDGGGLSHGRWMENLKLAVAVQQTLLGAHPTLMRPILLRNSRYNQHTTTGSLLVEVGAAGNSLDEALLAARLFAEGFLKTVRK